MVVRVGLGGQLPKHVRAPYFFAFSPKISFTLSKNPFMIGAECSPFSRSNSWSSSFCFAVSLVGTSTMILQSWSPLPEPRR